MILTKHTMNKISTSKNALSAAQNTTNTQKTMKEKIQQNNFFGTWLSQQQCSYTES